MLRARRLLLLLPCLAVLAACGGGSPSSSGYVPPPRQPPVLSDSIDIRGCGSSTMGGGLLAVCDPMLLKRSWAHHTLSEAGTLDVTIAGRKVRAGGSPGLTQVVPADGIGALFAPATVTLRGTASDGSYLYIRAESRTPDHIASGEALFLHIGLEHGGTASLRAALDRGRITFELRRPDGSTLEPLRSAHLEGPGPRHPLPQLPRGYADTPRQAIETYVAAIDARDGKTVCRLLSPDAASHLASADSPCWATMTGLIDYGGESDSPSFRRVDLTAVGQPSTATRGGVAFTGVRVTLRTHYLESRYSATPRTSDAHTTIWLRPVGKRWRIVGGGVLGASGGDASAPPDPDAALHARQGEQRRQRAEAAARRATLVRPGAVATCADTPLRLGDPRGDVTGGAGLDASADITAATLSFTRRTACLSVSVRGRPLAAHGKLLLQLRDSAAGGASPRFALFAIDDGMATHDGLHASVGTTPANARVAIRGRTLRASFDLPSSFPAPQDPRRLGWSLVTYAGSGASDRAEAGLTDAGVARSRAAREASAQLAKAAKAYAAAVVHFGRGPVRCVGKPVTAADAAQDAVLSVDGAATATSLAMSAAADLRSARVAVAGRHVCLAVAFARQPFGRRQRRFGLQLGLELTYTTRSKPFIQTFGFGVEQNAHVVNGLTYGGMSRDGGASLDPAGSHVALHGNTLVADFELGVDAPAFRLADLRHLSWKVGFFDADLADARTHQQGHDEIPDNPDGTGKSIPPAVRQSDGIVVKPY